MNRQIRETVTWLGEANVLGYEDKIKAVLPLNAKEEIYRKMVNFSTTIATRYHSTATDDIERFYQPVTSLSDESIALSNEILDDKEAFAKRYIPRKMKEVHDRIHDMKLDDDRGRYTRTIAR